MNIRDKYKELTGEFATHYQGVSDEFTEDYKKWLEQQVEKLFAGNLPSNYNVEHMTRFD